MSKYHKFLLIIFVINIVLTIVSLILLKVQIESCQKIDQIQTTLNNWTLNE
jgi:hypothetical protein